jgi:hypothetical protein
MPRSSWILLSSAVAGTVGSGLTLLVAPQLGVKFVIVAFPLAAFLALIERELSR